MMDTQFTVRRRPLDPMSQAYVHSRSRTTSSNVLPQTQPGQASRKPIPAELAEPAQPMMSMGPGYGAGAGAGAGAGGGYVSRSPSANTFSSVSSGMATPSAYRTSMSSQDQVRRSTSSRSGSASVNTASLGSPQTSYVALLRRQKATVWSERAQFEDPRLAAQQRAARMRAQQIVGTAAAGGNRTSTGLSAAGGKGSSKIRHGGKGSSTLGFGVDSNYVGIAGVPLRLSATEVEGEDSDEDELSAAAMRAAHHRRTGSSGRSSTASGGRRTAAQQQQQQVSRTSTGTTSFNQRTSSLISDDMIGGRDDAASGTARSTASGGSGSMQAERADQVPDLGSTAGRLPANSAAHAAVTRERSVRNTAEDLKRRGSVDERTMTMSTGRLFIANPD